MVRYHGSDEEDQQGQQGQTTPTRHLAGQQDWAGSAGERHGRLRQPDIGPRLLLLLLLYDGGGAGVTGPDHHAGRLEGVVT